MRKRVRPAQDYVHQPAVVFPKSTLAHANVPFYHLSQAFDVNVMGALKGSFEPSVNIDKTCAVSFRRHSPEHKPK
jgi:hypothetical protein